ncbi:MAG TPA: hypothetical protein ENK18_12015 [Deltaproteobacteria bacterium]|nr:hypothetical protein [Deltaproteobacteria bacterium]
MLSEGWLELGLRACVMVTVPVIAGAAWGVLRGLRRARPEAPDPVGCVACGEAEVAWIADGVYVCGCGYEGGPGHADWLRAERRRRLAGLPQEQRSALAIAALREARTLAGDADVVLRRLQRSLRAEVSDGSGRESRPWEVDLLSATGTLAQAFAQLELAADGLGGTAPAAPDLRAELWSDQLGQYDLVCVREDLIRARDGVQALQVAADRLAAAADRLAATPEPMAPGGR